MIKGKRRNFLTLKEACKVFNQPSIFFEVWMYDSKHKLLPDWCKLVFNKDYIIKEVFDSLSYGLIGFDYNNLVKKFKYYLQFINNCKFTKDIKCKGKIVSYYQCLNCWINKSNKCKDKIGNNINCRKNNGQEV